jgi:uncharacterized membrane protein (DUF485 family)
MMAVLQGHEPQDAAGQRRKARRTAWRLALFAFAVYIAFIIAFINRH